MSLLVALFASPLCAFDFDEHKYLSNVGLRAALDLAPACAVKGDAALFVDPANIAAKHSFGDLAALGDYVRDVDVLFERNGLSGLAIDRYSDLNWSRIGALKRDVLRFLQAAHINETHFQQSAMLSHLNNHESARALAQDGNIHRALVMEAFALHFLEDFHAPGHIAATRTAMVDYVAIASHGKYNNSGLFYQFRKQADALLPIIDHLLRDPSSLAALRHKNLRFEIEAQALSELRTLIETRGTLEFFGDSALEHHPVQAAYLAVLAARSVLDVFEASCHNDAGKNSFQPICWVLGRSPAAVECDPPAEAEGVVRAAAVPFGGWAVATHRFDTVWYKPWDVNLVSFYTEAKNNTEADLVRGQIAIESLLWSAASPSAFEQHDHGRLLNALLSANISIGYGYSHTFSDVPSNTVHAKFIYALPRVDLQVATTVGVRRYDLGRRSRLRYPLTVGLETGYGFVFVHLGVSDEYSVNPITSELTHSRSLRSGVTLVLPTKSGIDFVGRKMSRRGRRP
ncbi:MAG TPA: hypothetical protein VGQ36_28665 [Thermoanaerobaculia bacterium]|nr:hypothetical protein [Thermoanaerobaculia bacterium]